jgi:hypothetical protein
MMGDGVGWWPGRLATGSAQGEGRGEGEEVAGAGLVGWLGRWPTGSAQLPFVFFLFFSSISFSHLKKHLRHQNKSEKCK